MLATHCATALAAHTGQVLPVVMERMAAEGTRVEAVTCFGAFASTKPPVDLTPVLAPLLIEMASFLHKVQRSLRHATLAAAVPVLRSNASALVANGECADLLGQLLMDAAPLVSEDDLTLAAAALRMAAAAIAAVPTVGSDAASAPLTEAAVQLSASPLLSAATREALCGFFCALRDSGADAHSGAKLRQRLLDACPGDAPRAGQRSVAESVAALCASDVKLTKAALADCCKLISAKKTVRASSPQLAAPLVARR